MCISQCPSNGQTVSCLQDSVNCPHGTFFSAYDFVPFEIVCVKAVHVNGVDITSFFSYNSYSAWAFDLQAGYLILIGAAIAAMICSLIFLLIVRCCAGVMIWFAIAACISGLEIIGVLFILQAKGIQIAQFINTQLNTLSFNTLIIIGSGLIAAGVFILLLAFCLRSRIKMGSRAVELGAVFLL